MEDYYKILGIHPEASFEEIKEAYRRKAHKYHPDASGYSDDNKFKEAKEAFDILSNPQSRNNYDIYYKRIFIDSNSTVHTNTGGFAKGLYKTGVVFSKLSKFFALLVVIFLIIGGVVYLFSRNSYAPVSGQQDNLNTLQTKSDQFNQQQLPVNISGRTSNTDSNYSSSNSYTIEELGQKCIAKNITFCVGLSDTEAGLKLIKNYPEYYNDLTDSEKTRFDNLKYTISPY